ncbi:glycosyltransferase family 4 protein [Sphingomonas sp.]|uniref:glycosyltransferase family 4 protein n=1 Tax=Sphingomonas sp. TaxID=28214 RepID=UPI003B3BA6D1
MFNRDRDSYQVPVALNDAEMHEALVTDFYAPDRPPSWLPGFLRRKRHPGLPARFVRSDRVAFAVQYAAIALRRPMVPVWAWVSRQLGRTTGRLAQQRGAHLYCYHEYMPPQVPDDRCLIVFVFHPLRQRDYDRRVTEDRALYPEVEEAFLMEAAADASPSFPMPWTRPDAIVCASSETARSVVEAGAPADRIVVIPYGLPDRAVGAAEVAADRASGKARFLFVGTGSSQRKGVHHLLRAWRMRARPDAELVVVSAELIPAIAALADGDPTIRILGYQSRAELDALFASSDVFIMPSMLEGFGLVYVEALAAGCHVVATPHTGVPDLNLDADAATLVPSGDLAAIDNAIIELTGRARAGELDRAAISQAGRRWIQADFLNAIAGHARDVLAWRAGEGDYPSRYRYKPATSAVTDGT